MTLLGTLLRNRRAGDTHLAWNLPNLAGPERFTVTSPDLVDGGPIPLPYASRRVGGRDVSPPLAWSPLPADTVELLLVVEDPDVPLAKPVVHALALIDPARLDTADRLPADALSAARPAAGVRVLRSTVGRGYRGPAPIKGHGPHRYTFQLFALPAAVPGTAEGLRRAAPRRLLAAVPGPVLARGRITGTYER